MKLFDKVAIIAGVRYGIGYDSAILFANGETNCSSVAGYNEYLNKERCQSK